MLWAFMVLRGHRLGLQRREAVRHGNNLLQGQQTWLSTFPCKSGMALDACMGALVCVCDVCVCALTAASSLQWKARRKNVTKGLQWQLTAAYGPASSRSRMSSVCFSFMLSVFESLWHCYRKIHNLSIYPFSFLSSYFVLFIHTALPLIIPLWCLFSVCFCHFLYCLFLTVQCLKKCSLIC